jgi:hypothetical protein
MPYPDRHAYPDRNAYPDRFYPVVDSVAWVARLTKLGVGTVQLRAKDLDDAQALATVKEALAVIRGTRTRLVVNDYWRAAIEAGARDLHLGQEDLADADLKAIHAAGLEMAPAAVVRNLQIGEARARQRSDALGHGVELAAIEAEMLRAPRIHESRDRRAARAYRRRLAQHADGGVELTQARAP